MEENNPNSPAAAGLGEQTGQPSEPDRQIVVAPRAGPAGHGSSPQEPVATSPGRDMLGATAPRRVLQPSASFVQELRTSAAAQSDLVDQATTEPTQQPGDESVLTTLLTRQDVAANPVATIPIPIVERPPEPEQFRAPPPAIGQAQWHRRAPKPEGEQQPTGAKNSIILVGIYILGGLITLASGYNLYHWTHVRSLSGIGVEQVVALLLSVTLFLAGIGILRRKELGRIVYVFLAIITLALSLYGTVRMYRLEATAQKSIAAQIVYIQSSESDFRNTSDLPVESKQALLDSYDQQITELKKQQGTSLAETVKHLPRYVVVDYALAILPVVFLTRASVRAKFEN